MNPKELESSLLAANIYIADIYYKPHHTIFYLSCGLQIKLYNTSFRVDVKGTPRKFHKWDPIAALRHILPVKTVWLHTDS